MRIFINGFGRIGRTVFRQVLACDDIELVGINDIASLETCAYLFKYDSAFGTYPGAVGHAPGEITVAGTSVPFHQVTDLRSLDLSGVDVVLECTGRATTRDVAEAGLEAGAGRVLVSGPSPTADQTVVLGANDAALAGQAIVSNSSCTTNATAPLLKALDAAWGIVRAHVTTIHVYTGSQPTVDAPGKSLARSRAAAVSMIPTTTSAASEITQVLPGFADRLTVAAVRVPCLSVSAIDAVLQVDRAPADLVAVLREVFAGSPIIGLTEDACVSSDLRARPESLVIALPETQATGGQVRILGWYDNEWGFSARMLDMTRRMAG